MSSHHIRPDWWISERYKQMSPEGPRSIVAHEPMMLARGRDTRAADEISLASASGPWFWNDMALCQQTQFSIHDIQVQGDMCWREALPPRSSEAIARSKRSHAGCDDSIKAEGGNTSKRARCSVLGTTVRATDASLLCGRPWKPCTTWTRLRGSR